MDKLYIVNANTGALLIRPYNTKEELQDIVVRYMDGSYFLVNSEDDYMNWLKSRKK